jgi:hypothetical protein
MIDWRSGFEKSGIFEVAKIACGSKYFENGKKILFDFSTILGIEILFHSDCRIAKSSLFEFWRFDAEHRRPRILRTNGTRGEKTLKLSFLIEFYKLMIGFFPISYLI